jgi:hypothetical protein
MTIPVICIFCIHLVCDAVNVGARIRNSESGPYPELLSGSGSTSEVEDIFLKNSTRTICTVRRFKSKNVSST